MTEKPRAADPGSAGSAPGGSAPAGPKDRAGERVVIRDKRKVHPDGGGSKSDDAEASAPETTPEPDADQAVDSQAGKPTEPAVPVDDADVAEIVEPVGEEPVVDAPVEPVGEAPPERSGSLGAELEALRSELDERTRDLQRISAEYANYRKRVDRDKGLVVEQATAAVLTALLPVLDDLDRAREHGDLVGPFGTVAEQLNGIVAKLGLTPFGEKGDSFDPTRHEAVAHRTSSEVTESTCVDVMRRGYLLGERLLRAALVAVADPE